MVTLESALDAIPVVSLIVVLAYYTITVKNQNKTRQAQLLMGLYESYRSREERELSLEIQSWEWDTFDDFFDKYGYETNPRAWAIFEAKAAFFHGIGVLLEGNLIDIKLLDRLLTNSVNRHWNFMRMGSLLVDWRNRKDDALQDRERFDQTSGEGMWVSMKETSFLGFDYLFSHLTEYRKAHPVSPT